MAKRGKLIVIDGQDGVGKATQTKLLVSRLRSLGGRVETLDFPQYEDNLFGKFIGDCVMGKHGEFVKLDPYLISVFFAVDRFESKPKIEKWLKSGVTVILDRYVSSNQLHQGGKIYSMEKRKVFFDWLSEVEHGLFGLPKPDALIYLSVPTKISMKLMRDKDRTLRKKYTKGGVDPTERNFKYLDNARKSGLKILEGNSRWHKIDCAPKGTLLSKEEVHDLVFATITRIIRIKKR